MLPTAARTAPRRSRRGRGTGQRLRAGRLRRRTGPHRRALPPQPRAGTVRAPSLPGGGRCAPAGGADRGAGGPAGARAVLRPRWLRRHAPAAAAGHAAPAGAAEAAGGIFRHHGAAPVAAGARTGQHPRTGAHAAAAAERGHAPAPLRPAGVGGARARPCAAATATSAASPKVRCSAATCRCSRASWARRACRTWKGRCCCSRTRASGPTASTACGPISSSPACSRGCAASCSAPSPPARNRDAAYTSTEVLRELAQATGLPCAAGFPIGHGAVNEPVPLGVRVRLDADARQPHLPRERHRLRRWPLTAGRPPRPASPCAPAGSAARRRTGTCRGSRASAAWGRPRRRRAAPPSRRAACGS